MFRTIVAVLLTLGLLSSAGPAAAEEARNRTDFAIALSGLPVANAVFRAVRNDGGYEINAEIASTGIANFFAQTEAEMSSTGSMRNGELHPERFFFRYRYGKRHRMFETQFKSGNVVSSVIEPQPKARRKNWIAIRPEHLRAVSDPVAGLILPETGDPCRPKIPVYDGESRLDLLLSDKGTNTFKTEGFDGPVVVCGLRYEPRSGYRRNHSDMEYVRRLKGMEIWFAKSPTMHVYAPVFLSVPTKYGTITMRATRFDG
jgi:hypothetical protein